MIRLLSWLLGLPLIAAIAVFAVANRQETRFDLWPLPWAVEIPAYLALLGPLAIGLVLGAVMTWASGAGRRMRARQDRRRVESLERQLAAQSKSI